MTASDVVIDGLTLDTDSLTTGDTTGSTTVGVALRTGVSNVQIINNIFTDNGYGVRAYSGASDILISQNLFDGNNRFNDSHAVFLNGSGASGIEVSDNVFRNTYPGYGGGTSAVQVHGAAGQAVDDVRILRNTSTNDGSFVVVYLATNVTISDNTSTSQAGSAVLVGGGVQGIVISENDLTDSMRGVRFSTALHATATTDATIADNAISSMTEAGVEVLENAIASSLTVTGNLLVDNGVGIRNLSSQAVVANDNWWGCSDGPTSNSCDGIEGNVVVDSWIGEDPVIGDDDTVGAPNTGAEPATSVMTLAVLIGFTLVTAAGAVVAKRHIAKQ